MQIEQELRKIYFDLSKAKLSQTEALEKIKAIKMQEQSKAGNGLLATPVWESSELEASDGASKSDYGDHHIIVCELPRIDIDKLASLLPHSQCMSLPFNEGENIAQRYSEHALACFERVKAILQGG